MKQNGFVYPKRDKEEETESLQSLVSILNLCSYVNQFQLVFDLGFGSNFKRLAEYFRFDGIYRRLLDSALLRTLAPTSKRGSEKRLKNRGRFKVWNFVVR